MSKKYYRVVLWNSTSKDRVVGMLKAEDYFEAETLGRQAAEKWRSQGFQFWGVDYFSTEIEKLDRGEVIYF